MVYTTHREILHTPALSALSDARLASSGMMAPSTAALSSTGASGAIFAVSMLFGISASAKCSSWSSSDSMLHEPRHFESGS